MFFAWRYVFNRGVAQLGSVLEWGSRGREFESRHSDHAECPVMDALFFYCKNSERRWLTVPARKTAWFCTRSADRRIALSCPSPVPKHPKFIRFPSLRSALLHFRTKFQFFCRKDLHCPAFSAIIHVVADADVAQSVERILGKDEVAGSNPAISSTKCHLPL